MRGRVEDAQALDSLFVEALQLRRVVVARQITLEVLVEEVHALLQGGERPEAKVGGVCAGAQLSVPAQVLEENARAVTKA